MKDRIIIFALIIGLALSSMLLGYQAGVRDERLRQYEQQIEYLRAEVASEAGN